MAQTTDFQSVLIEQVAVPEFFKKVASDVGVTPHDAKAASELRVLGDRVVAAVSAYQQKQAAARGVGIDNLIKGAAHAGHLLGGVPEVTVQSGSYLTVAGVSDAALAAVAARKQAMEACAAPPASAAVAEAEDELDENGKKKEPKV